MRLENRIYIPVIILFFVSRITLYLLGVKMVILPDMMPFLDLEWLKEDFWASLYAYHLMPPLNNFIYGALFILFGDNLEIPALILYLILGLVLVLCFVYLLNKTGLKNRYVILISFLFICSPPAIYFETFLLYTYPTVTAFLVLTVVLHKFFNQPSAIYLILIGLLSVFLYYIRSIFHLVWVVPFFVALCWYRKDQLKQSVLILSIPLLLILALNFKNQFQFGFFGASSWIGSAISKLTVYNLPETTKDELIERGELHPIFRYKVYAPPDSLAEFFDLDEGYGFRATDEKLKRDSSVNYNHWVYIEASKIKKEESLKILRKYPQLYIRQVMWNCIDFFSPTTRWHPHDETRSPHLPNRAKIGGYESLYNTIIHTFPVPRIGLYGFIIPIILMVFVKALKDFSQNKRDNRNLLLLFMLFNIAFVFAVSVLVETPELERYRFLVEPFIWLVVIHFFLNITGYFNFLKSFIDGSKAGAGRSLF